MTRRAIPGVVVAAVLGAVLLVWLGLWAWLLAAENPPAHRLARLPIFPVACATRGCVTSATWAAQQDVASDFARAAGSDVATPEQTLTSVLRRYLVEHAFLRQPVSLADARRYRQEVLNISGQESLEGIVTTSIDEYDRRVVLPLLLSEALKGELSVESSQELYRHLAGQRKIILLPFHFRWDMDTGEALAR